MKDSKQCPKCHSRKVGHIDQVAYGDAGATTDETYKPLPLGTVPTPKRWVGPKSVPVGQFEAYVCASCGYYEIYLKGLEQIPFDDIDGFRWLNPEE
jgi:predicted nucleic-acid-binding Zn-ribbon protein